MKGLSSTPRSHFFKKAEDISTFRALSGLAPDYLAGDCQLVGDSKMDWDLCDPLSDVSALCHVRTARSAIDPSRRLGRVHGMSCRSIYATLLYRWLSSMHIWRPIYFSSRVGLRRICDIYDFFAPHINVLTYLLTVEKSVELHHVDNLNFKLITTKVFHRRVLYCGLRLVLYTNHSTDLFWMRHW